MKKTTYFAVFAVLLVAAGATWHHLGHPGLDHHGEHSHGGAPAEMTLNSGQKWKTDQALRDGMGKMHRAVLPAFASYNAKALGADEAKQVASLLRGEIDLLFKNCKLEPMADATLHPVLADILNGASNLEKDPLSPGGLPKIVEALHRYDAFFEPSGL